MPSVRLSCQEWGQNKSKERKGGKAAGNKSCQLQAEGFGMQVAKGRGKSKGRYFLLLYTQLALTKVPVIVTMVTIAPWEFSHVPGTELRYLYP